MATSKPSYSTPISLSQPKAQGLLALFPFNERDSDTTVTDIVRRAAFDTSSVTDIPRRFVGAGNTRGLYLPGTLQGSPNVTGPLSAAHDALTVIWHGVVKSGKQGSLLAVSDNTFRLRVQSSGTLSISIGLSGSAELNQENIPFSMGQPVTVIVKFHSSKSGNQASGTGSVWVNGTRTATFTAPVNRSFNVQGTLALGGEVSYFNAADNSDAEHRLLALYSREIGDAEAKEFGTDPYLLWAAPVPTASGYRVRVKSVAYQSSQIPIAVAPVPKGSQFPRDFHITVTVSGQASVSLPVVPLGENVLYVPAFIGKKSLAFTNNKNLTDPVPSSLTTYAAVDIGPHIAPARTRGTQMAQPAPGYVYRLHNTEFRARNIFHVDEQPNALLPGRFDPIGSSILKVDSYEVRDWEGAVVDSGKVTHGESRHTTVFFNVAAPGWYRVAFFDSTRRDRISGDASGEFYFVIVTPDPNHLTPEVTGDLNAADFFPSQEPFFDGTGPLNAELMTGPEAPTYTRFTGILKVPLDGIYHFDNSFGSRCRLTVNGQKVIDKLSAEYHYTEHSLHVELSARLPYRFVLDTWTKPGTKELLVNWNRAGGGVSGNIPDGATGDANGVAGRVSIKRWAGYAYDGYDDILLRGWIGAPVGPVRLSITNKKTFSEIRPTLRAIKDLLKADPARPKSRFILAFTGWGNADSVSASGVSTLIGDVLAMGFAPDDFVIEGTNEPNLQGMSGKGFVAIIRNLHKLVKAISPQIQIIGPATVALSPSDLTWIDDFLAAGGAQYLDGFSFHAYNAVNGDFCLARRSMGALVTLLAKHNLRHLPLWQTEQGEQFALYGISQVRHGLQWTSRRLLMGEQHGLPLERNSYWYDRYGFLDFPMWLHDGAGGLTPHALMLRVMGQELYGKTRKSDYAFKENRRDIYAGSLFQGPGAAVAWFQSNGDPEGRISVTVTGTDALLVVDWKGQLTRVPVTGGKATIPVPDVPVYVRIPNGVTIALEEPNWGKNLALAATARSTFGEKDTALINNGRNEYGDRYYPGSGDTWQSLAPLAYEDAPLELAWTSPQTINLLVLHCPPIWQLLGAPLVLDAEYHNGRGWVRLASIVEPVKYVPAFSKGAWSTLDDYSRNRNIWQIGFDAVRTKRVRVVCRIATHGGNALKIGTEAGGQGWDKPWFSVREFQAYHVTGGGNPY